ncbi:MAG: hypothetical protein WA821_23300 [Anaerolineales bacterium]
MSRIPLRLILAIAVTAFSLTLLTWSLSTPARAVRRQIIQPTQMQLPTPPAAATQSAAAVPEMRSLSIDYPPVIRADEADRVRLTVEMDRQVAGIPSVYDTHHVLAEARLEMGGIQVRPPDTVSEPLLPGQSVTFFWSVQPNEAGRFKGTLWFYLRFVPKDGGPEVRQAISAQEIEIESTTLFGLRAEAARGLGLVGVFVSALLDLPFLIDALKWFWKKCAGLLKPIR